ncbi:CDP-glycerol glycerophosphotransferase family protein [Streptomyces sp. enrichment culture]|uniref:CDP-glycerol glycerophosphotransferase family protein n=1 Tax=Streptomyces sp. enrichment culture TaxID=1795815 RepID=UPI003F577B18
MSDTIPEELARGLRFLPEADEEERTAFLAAARDHWKDDAAGLDRLPPAERLAWTLVRQGRLDEAVALQHFQRSHPGGFHVRGLRRTRAVFPEVGQIPLNGRKDLPVHSKLTALEWQPDGKLRVRGWAYVANVPMAQQPKLPRFGLLWRKGSRRRTPFTVRAVRMPEATAASKQALHCYDWSGFEFVLDPEKLPGSGRPGVWQLGLILPGPGGPHGVRPVKNVVGSGGHTQVRHVSDGRRLVAGFDSKGRLQITLDAVPAEISGHRKDGSVLELTVRRHGTGVTALQIGDHHYPVAENGTARVPLARLHEVETPYGKTHDWHCHLLLADGGKRRATVSADFSAGSYDLPGGREIALTTDGPGLLKMHDRARQPVVDSLSWTAEGALVLEGEFGGPGEGARLVLRHGGQHEEKHLPLEYDPATRRFRASVQPLETATYDPDVTLPLRKGRWYFAIRAAGVTTHRKDVPVKLRADMVGRLPLEHEASGRSFRVERRYFDRIYLDVESPLGEDERGAYRQHLLRTEFTEQHKKLPLRDAVFYNSFGGKQFSDSPRAIHEELVRRGVEVEHLWSVADGQVALPEGVTPLEWHSKEWYEALARSRYVVTNVGLGDWFTKREGQTVVQTWHGTPLKKIGADLLGTPKANRAYIASLPHRFRQFDITVSPNAFTTPVMKRAFCAEGEVLEAGYPRNDLFHSPERAAIATRVRKVLGIPADKKVVLYAPTWRDDQRHGGQRFKLDLKVDLAAAERELGDDHVFLFRKHPKILDAIPGAGEGFVFDVSGYPDIAELYLIADVLITDYSSVLFDFAHSGRPMLFFTYDLEHYRDTLRGFYFDFTERAPGPLIKTSEELVAAIRDIDAVAEAHKDRYADFVRDFCEPSDGLATARVVDRMLELGRR